MRLIDADAFEVVAFNDRGGTFSDGVQWILEKIDNMPTVEAQQWIPCDREFPPNMKYVLVSDGISVWEDRLSKHDGIWVECATYQSDSYSWAWCELPKPYKGEDHDSD